MPATPLLERDHLLRDLEHLIGEARRGSGSLALIAGEAGSGKTSLCRTLVERAGGHVLVLQGHCDPLITPRALSPLHDMAANPDSGLAGMMSEERESAEIYALVLDRLRKTLRPILMIVEDIHWADEATFDFLRYVGRRIESSKAVVACTYRHDEIGPEHPLRTTLGHLTRLASTKMVEIPPLSQQAVEELIGHRALDPRKVHDLTGGNAFFVTEVIAGDGGLPETVRGAVLTRVQMMEGPPRSVAEAVSIAPRSLELDRAAALSGSGFDAIDAAVAAGVILAEGGKVRFRHELARAAVEENLPPAKRLDLHRRMLNMLEDEGAADLARLAHHAIRAGEGQKIVEYAPAAARDAHQRASPRESTSLYQAALAHADLMAGDEAAELRMDLSYQLGQIDDPEGSLAEAKLAADHFRRLDNPERLALALIRMTIGLWRLKDIPRARRTIDEAIELLEALEPSSTLAYAHYMSAHHHMLARHAGEARTTVAVARSVAEHLDQPLALWNATMMEGTIEIVLGDPVRGAEILKGSADQAQLDGDQSRVGVALSMLGSGAGEARLYTEALPAIEEALSRGLARDQDYSVAYMRAWKARIAFEQGRWDEAVQYAELVDRTAHDRVGFGLITALGALGRVRVRRGDSGAVEVLEPIVASQADYEIQHVWSPIAGLAEHHWLRGELDGMKAVLDDGYTRAMDTDSVWARGEMGFWMWRAGAIDGPPDRAAEPFALQMQGRWKEAADAWDELGCPYEVGLSLLDGDQEAIAAALKIFEGLGARPAMALARRRLKDLGVAHIPRGPSAGTRVNPAGLTNRQVEVLKLMGEGLTNAEIAERLYISAKTVEHHVSAILGKLGVATRAKAVAASAHLSTR